MLLVVVVYPNFSHTLLGLGFGELKSFIIPPFFAGATAGLVKVLLSDMAFKTNLSLQI